MNGAARPAIPYVGLRPFEREDSLRFFGRREQTAELLESLYRQRFLSVVGSSGCGKSSLVRAGLVPALLGGFLVEARDRWLVATLKPGDGPLRNLAAALLLATGEQCGSSRVDSLAQAIAQDLISAIKEFVHPCVGEDGNLLLLVDQFEEVFSFRGREDEERLAEMGPEERRERVRRRREADAFVGLLLDLAELADLPVFIVLTMRTDFLGDCDLFYGLPEAMNRGRYLVPRLTREQLREAIEGPALLGEAAIAPRLLERLLNELGDRSDRLPVLQHALLRTWEIRADEGSTGPLIIDHYTRAGGIDKALDRHANEALQDIDLDVTARIFRCLTDTDSNQRRVRRPANLDDIAAVCEGEATREAVTAIIERFRADNRNFLVLSEGPSPDNPRVDISHESLIRQWEKLRNWVDEERDSRDRFRELVVQARRHQQGKGALLQDPDLQLVLDWKDKSKPTEPWAKRYSRSDDDYSAAMAYLEQSRFAAAEAVRLAARSRRRQKFATYFIISVLISLTSWAFISERQAKQSEMNVKQEKNRADIQTDHAVIQGFIAKTERDRANEKAHLAEMNQREAEGATASAKKAFRDAIAGKLLMQSRAIIEGRQQGKTDIASLLSAVAFRLLPNNEAYNCLQLAMNSIPGIVRPVRFADPVRIVSPDFKTVITVDYKTIRLWDLDSGKSRGAPMKGHSSVVSSVAISPDGSTVASGSWDETVCLWDAASDKLRGVPLKGHTGNVNSVAFSPDGKIVASGSEDKTIRLWDVATGQALGEPLEGHSDGVTSVAFSPDGRTIVSGSLDKTARLWDVATGQPSKTYWSSPLDGHEAAVWSVAFSPDNRTVATGSEDNTIRLWNVRYGGPLEKGHLQRHTSAVMTVAFSPDGRSLVSGSADKTVRLWDAATGQPRGAPLKGLAEAVMRVDFSPDGKTVAYHVSGDKNLYLWDVASGQPRSAPLEGHSSEVTSVAFCPDNKTVASGSWDKTFRLWDIATGKHRVATFEGYNAVGWNITFSPDGNTVFYGSNDMFRMWDVVTGESRGGPLQEHTDIINTAAFSPDSKTLATGSDDMTVRLWEVITGKPRGAPLKGHNGHVNSVAFSPNGKLVASGSDDKTVLLWDVVTAKARGPHLKGHTGHVRSVAFSPDGKIVASGSDDKSIRLWDVTTGKQRGAPLEGHSGSVERVIFSPNGSTVASLSRDNIRNNTLRLWDVATGQPRGIPISNVNSVDFSPDGRTIVSGIDDNTIIFLDAVTGQSLGTPFRGHNSGVSSVAFSPDGMKVVSGSVDNNLILWDAPDAWIDRVCDKLVRNLSHAEWKKYVGDITYVKQCPNLPVPAD